MIEAIILAAGESRRMGEPKLVLPFGEKTIIESVIDNVIRSRVDKVLVVLGSDAEKIERIIKDYPLRMTINPDYKKGMLSSVQWGFKALEEETQAALICLGDQPSISTTVIDKVIGAYKQTKKGIVVPVFQKSRGHPPIIDIKYRREVEDLDPDVGLRGLVYNHPEDTVDVEVDSPAILRDVDDQQDYKKELKNRD